MALELDRLFQEYPTAMLAWLVVLTVLVLFLLFFNKEKFLGEFASAPIASRKPTSFLGNGNPLRFSTEFSSTNQSGSLPQREHMVASVESPVWNDTNRLVEGNFASQGNEMAMVEEITGDNHEGFRPMFENFSTEGKLKNIMMGL